MKVDGKYLKDVEELKALKPATVSYERIFKLYTATKEDKEFYFFNILRKVNIPENIDAAIVNYYDVKSNLPLTIISHEIYGEQRLWWLIAFLNREIISKNIFVVESGTRIKYIQSEYLQDVLFEINNIITNNGRHY
jgi:hypothetical protein